MTKQEYLASLERRMSGLDAQERRAQLAYYSEMFDDMLEDGLTEAEAAARLEAARREAGEPETARLSESAAAKQKAPKKHRMRAFFISVLVAVLLVPTSMIAAKVIFGVVRSGASVGDAVEAVVVSIREDRDWSGVIQDDGFYTVDPAATAVVSLDISWTSGSVKVTVWDQDYIGFGEGPQDPEYALRWCVDDGTLYIQDYRSVLDAGLAETKNLTVQLPVSLASSLHDFSFEGVSADLTAEGLCADDFTTETASGAVWADVNCNNAEFDSVSGDLSFFGQAEQIAVNTTSGAVALAVEGASALRVGTVSGDVSLMLPEELCAVVDFGTVSGKVVNRLKNVAVNPKGESAEALAGELVYVVSTTSGGLTIVGK